MDEGGAGSAHGLCGATRKGSALLFAVSAGSAYAQAAARASAPAAIDIVFITFLPFAESSSCPNEKGRHHCRP
jgi:hypothetical protein